MSTLQPPQPGMKTRDLTPQELQNLAPAERDTYLQQKAAEGVDPSSWLWGPIQELIARAKAKQQAQQLGDQAENQATAGRDVQYVQGLQPSNADYMGDEHSQLKSFVNTNLDVQQVADISTAYFDVHKAFDTFAKTMGDAVNKSKGTWEGPAAENAQAYFTSLSKWSDANSQNARLASETTYDQSTAAQNAKNSMPEPIPFSWGDEMKSWFTSNPLDFADNIDKSIQKQKDSQAAHEQAANVMHTYDQSLYAAASKQPVFAEPPTFGTGGGVDQSNPPDGSGGSGHNGGSISGGSGGIGGGGGAGGSGSFRPGGVPGGGSGVPGAGMPGSGHYSGAAVQPGGVTPSSFNPSSVTAPPPAGNPNNMGGMPMAPMPMSGGFGNFGGDEDYNTKIGRGGGFGPGGSGGGGGTASGAANPGSGNASGAARPGGVGAAEAAGRGMGGLGSSRGTGMGSGMGPHGKGKGEEDTEHQRPTYLVEGDPDEVFGTDQRTAPPVIGE